MPSPPHTTSAQTPSATAARARSSRLVGVAALEVADDEAGVAQPWQGGRGAAAAPLPLPDVGLVRRAISRASPRALH